MLRQANGHIHGVEFVAIPAGNVMLGCDMDPEKGFRWDNEGPLQVSPVLPDPTVSGILYYVCQVYLDLSCISRVSVPLEDWESYYGPTVSIVPREKAYFAQPLAKRVVVSINPTVKQ